MSATYGPAPIDLLHDSEAVRNFKAGNGWLWYALRNAGCSDEQISNGLATYVDSVNAVSAERIRQDMERQGAGGQYDMGMKRAAFLITPAERP